MTEVIVPILWTADAAATAQWYQRLDFKVVGEHRFAPDLPLYMFLERGSVQLHLSEHSGDARPNTLVYLWVDDVDRVAAEFDIDVSDRPWGREINLVDPDGNRLRIATGVT